ncbi:MAG: alpha/beta hydrolase [Bacillota bacterium]|nr:alpha/beta hydrolase [Bacillota bacterium]
MATENWQSFRVKNRRDQKLAAMLRKSNTPDSTLIIVCHGFTGSKEGQGQAVEIGEQLYNRGYSTLLFDFAGSGESEGVNKERTLSNQVEDLEAIVTWAKQEDFNRIILSGRSFGGSTVLSYSALDKDITAVCTWAAVARLERLFLPLIGGKLEGPADEVIKLESEEGCLELKRRFFLDLRNHDMLKYAAEVAPRSFLLVHGTNDESVPPKDAELIYDAAAEPKKLVWIEGADHRFSGYKEQVWKTFFSWLDNLPA